MTTTTTTTPPPAAADRDVACPLCDYNLRGLVDPRCPECGYAFTWDDLLDPARRKHPYLFEHHPRRNVVSFVRTLLGGLRPRRFWRTLNPAMPSRPLRLAIYSMLATALLVSAPLVSFARHYADVLSDVPRDRRRVQININRFFNDPEVQAAIAKHGSVEALVDVHVPPAYSPRHLSRAYASFTAPEGEIRTVLVMAAWPWLTLASLMIFRWSMRRAKVRTGHVVRCVVYGFDWGFWLVPLVLLLISGDLAHDVLGLWPNESVPILASLVFAVYGSYRLGAAYANYLRFSHPYATAIASQLIVLLVMTSITLK